MRRVLCLLPLLLAVTACDTVGDGAPPSRTGIDVSTLSHDTAALVGTWDLVSVTPSGECAGEGCTRTQSAAKAGQEARLVFRADGVVTYTFNGSLLAGGSYGTYAAEPGDIPVLYIGADLHPFGVDDDRLYLDDRYVDGPLLEFERR